jgi:hypothetical protein
VAEHIDLPPGYVVLYCQRCRAAFATPAISSAAWCSLACAEAAQRPRPALLRAPMQVEPQLRRPVAVWSARTGGTGHRLGSSTSTPPQPRPTAAGLATGAQSPKVGRAAG